MCLYPKQILNRSHYVSFEKSSKLFYTVPCGHCSECIAHKRKEYTIRAIVESKDSQINNGFCYMDTLTYSPKHLPNYNGMPCFSKLDVRNFLKRLHITLSRKGFQITKTDKNGKLISLLKHFITCEYGENRNRPHYHVIFFSSIPELTPFILWRTIRDTWQKGFNNAPNTWQNYIVDNASNAVSYVTKYVTKDSHFINKLHNLHTSYIRLLDELYSKGYNETDENVINVKSMLEAFENPTLQKDLYPFHLQSNGFGENLLEHFNYDEIFEKGYILVINGQKSVKYPIPMYNIRKMFYDKVINQYPNPSTLEKVERFVLNDEGIRYKMLHSDFLIHRYIDDTLNKFQKIKQVINSKTYELFSRQANLLLKEINLLDYAKYELYYRFSLCSDSKSIYQLIFDQSSLYDGKDLFCLDDNKLKVTFDSITEYFDINKLYLLTPNEKVSTDIEKYNRLSSLIEDYYRIYKQQKDKRFFNNEELNYKFKNG